MRFRSTLLLAALLALSACDSGADTAETTAVYVGNQGIFSDNSGSVTAYSVETGTADADAVANLGGLVQSLAVRGDRLYVLLNFDDSFTTGRGRIDVVDLRTGTRERQIDVETPRAIAFTETTAYVTNLYDNTVTPVTPATGGVGTPIATGGVNPEGVAVVGQRVYVANFGFGNDSSVSVFSTRTNTLLEKKDVGCDGPRAVLADDDGEVWVFCTGRTIYDDDFNVIGQTNGEAVVLDGASGEVVARIAFSRPVGTSSLGQDAAFSPARDEMVVVVGTDVVRFDTRTNTRAETIAIGGADIAAVAYDDATDRLFLGRLNAQNPFSGDGVVTIHDRTGAEVGRFTAGVIPGAIAFRDGR